METITFEQVVQTIVADYFDTFNITPISIKYSIVDDMAQAYSQLRPEHARKEPQKIATLNQYNGSTVAPDNVSGMFTILLNQRIIQDSYKDGNSNWIGTIAHETTHVIDFTNYAVLLGANDFEEILSISKNAMFQLWTEFNARAKGYYFVRKYSFEDMFDEAQVSDILNIEIPAQEDLLFQNYHATTDGMQQAYLVSHYLGRLYALQQIFPKTFTDEQVQNLIPPNPWMFKWFLFLKSHTELEVAYPCFEEMKNILRENFSGL
jgi:hypothetical protein